LLAVAKLDRFSRDPVSAAMVEAELQRHGASIACADGNGSGDDATAELVRGILLTVARFEKALIRARITAALAVKKSRGELTGKAPYGYRVSIDGKTLDPDESEQRTLSAVRRLRKRGLTIRALQVEAARRGLLSRTGRPFTVAALHRMVASALDGCAPRRVPPCPPA
jgi:DNA invertase Pin-like site-specific DNA recombinase